MSNEHVFLVGVKVTTDLDRAPAEPALHTLLAAMSSLAPHTPLDKVAWWIAEDGRRDGSQGDSAIFVPIGTQREAQRRTTGGRLHSDPPPPVYPRDGFISGDWLMSEEGELGDTGKVHWCFPAVITGHWGGGVEVKVNRTVAEAIARRQPTDPGSTKLVWVPGQGPEAGLMPMLLAYNLGEDSDPWVEESRPGDDRLYDVGFGWAWYEVHPEENPMDAAGFRYVVDGEVPF